MMRRRQRSPNRRGGGTVAMMTMTRATTRATERPTDGDADARGHIFFHRVDGRRRSDEGDARACGVDDGSVIRLRTNGHPRVRRPHAPRVDFF